jgi:hypothetical protein
MQGTIRIDLSAAALNDDFSAGDDGRQRAGMSAAGAGELPYAIKIADGLL